MDGQVDEESLHHVVSIKVIFEYMHKVVTNTYAVDQRTLSLIPAVSWTRWAHICY